jgi:hypothetical protein
MSNSSPPPSTRSPGRSAPGSVNRTPTPAASGAPRAQGGPWGMRTVRYILPGVVVLAGIVVMALGSEADLEGGGGIVSAGLAIFLINWLFRAGTSGDRERQAEDAARDYFDVHGRWPD